MKTLFRKLTSISPGLQSFHVSMLLFRVAISVELVLAHGLKKIGIGVAQPEQVPNPLHLPDLINGSFALAANLFFPVFVVLGLFTRLAILPILAVTVTGYFVLHWHDPILIKDMPFMYSLAYLLILVLGPGKYSVDYFINRRSNVVEYGSY